LAYKRIDSLIFTSTASIYNTFISVFIPHDLMHKHASFAITAAVLLTAIVTVTLYTVNAANAQGNATNATGGTAKNMTNATGGTAKNMTNATGGTAKNMTGEAAGIASCVKVLNREEC
jgi:hypothetical protein